MRIRKNAKHSPLLYSHGSTSVPLETAFQTHVCQLNQSPWDVIPFASDFNQFVAEDSFTENNGSHVDSIGAVESVASMMDIDEKNMPKIEDTFVKDNNTEGMKSILFRRREKEHKSFSCQKTDGKGWQCKKEAKPGQSFCDHHYAMLKSYNNNNNNHSSSSHQSKKSAAATVAVEVTTATATATATARRARPRALSKKSSSSSNPYEFYYYSGFGPSWGRRRGDRSEGNNKLIETKPAEAAADNDNNVMAAATIDANGCNRQSGCGSPYSSPSSQIDYVDDDDDDEEEEEEEDSGKKRMRKPVKARSLKSLM